MYRHRDRRRDRDGDKDRQRERDTDRDIDTHIQLIQIGRYIERNGIWMYMVYGHPNLMRPGLKQTDHPQTWANPQTLAVKKALKSHGNILYHGVLWLLSTQIYMYVFTVCMYVYIYICMVPVYIHVYTLRVYIYIYICLCV